MGLCVVVCPLHASDHGANTPGASPVEDFDRDEVRVFRNASVCAGNDARDSRAVPVFLRVSYVSSVSDPPPPADEGGSGQRREIYIYVTDSLPRYRVKPRIPHRPQRKLLVLGIDPRVDNIRPRPIPRDVVVDILLCPRGPVADTAQTPVWDGGLCYQCPFGLGGVVIVPNNPVRFN